MAKAIRFYKKILALATAAVLVAGMPMSVQATENGNSGSETGFEAVQDDDEDPEDTDDDADTSDEENTDSEDDTEDSEDTADTDGSDSDSDDEDSDESEEDEEPAEGVELLEEDHPAGILMIDPDPVDEISAEGTSGGSGAIRITTIKKPKNVISMVVPIMDDINYNFILDPEGLITSNPNNTIIGGSSTLYFKSDDSDNTYSIFADVAAAVNKSTVPVLLQVELNVSVEGTGINMTDLNGVYSAEEPSLCLAILPTEIETVTGNDSVGDLSIYKDGMAMTDSDGNAYKDIVIPGSVDNFELVTLPTDEEDYFIQEYRPLDDAQWSAAGFSLYGACSRETKWDEVVKNLQNGGNISFTVTYRITPIIEEEEEE